MLLKVLILVKIENIIEETQSYEYIIFIIFRDKMQVPTALLLFLITQGRIHIFGPKYILLLVLLETVCKKRIWNLDFSIDL